MIQKRSILNFHVFYTEQSTKGGGICVRACVCVHVHVILLQNVINSKAGILNHTQTPCVHVTGD